MELTVKAAKGGVCLSPALEYYMTTPVKISCSEISIGIKFTNPVDGLKWLINTIDATGNIIDSVRAGKPFYLMIIGTGRWGIGYMPHLYVPGNYLGVPMTWKESWVGSPSYTGSAEGDIIDLDDITNRNPIRVYKPNLVIKTTNFANATGSNTLIVAQEQVFLGWWGGPWTEPDGEVITWTFGPFVLKNSADFYFRILMSPVWNDDIYVADYKFTIYCE
jgi:hypothetical protein